MGRSLCDVLNLTPPDGDEESVHTWQEHALKMLQNIISVRLKGRQKQIIMLYYYEGLSQREIARQLGISESSVSHTKRRACKKLEYDLNLIRR